MTTESVSGGRRVLWRLLAAFLAAFLAVLTGVIGAVALVYSGR